MNAYFTSTPWRSTRPLFLKYLAPSSGVVVLDDADLDAVVGGIADANEGEVRYVGEISKNWFGGREKGRGSLVLL
jgi:hypothetical protein